MFQHKFHFPRNTPIQAKGQTLQDFNSALWSLLHRTPLESLLHRTTSSLPLLIFANGPSTSMELCANSGPLKDCWSCIILPMDGSLPKAPPVQYSAWAPVAYNKQADNDLYQFKKDGLNPKSTSACVKRYPHASWKDIHFPSTHSSVAPIQSPGGTFSPQFAHR